MISIFLRARTTHIHSFGIGPTLYDVEARIQYSLHISAGILIPEDARAPRLDTVSVKAEVSWIGYGFDGVVCGCEGWSYLWRWIYSCPTNSRGSVNTLSRLKMANVPSKQRLIVVGCGLSLRVRVCRSQGGDANGLDSKNQQIPYEVVVYRVKHLDCLKLNAKPCQILSKDRRWLEMRGTHSWSMG
jgi:hypothetical protein